MPITNKKDADDPHHRFKVTFAGHKGVVGMFVPAQAKWEPKVGEEVEGEMTHTEQYGWEFKRKRKGGFGGGGRPRSPEETAAIQRQHSQHMALLYVQAKAAAGQAPENFTPDEHLRPIINWFDSDIPFGVQRAMQRK